MTKSQKTAPTNEIGKNVAAKAVPEGVDQWWEAWASNHKSQIEAYNDDVAQNGLWSDGLRLF
jgi:Post-segregation antitoxin CcdA